MNFTGMGRNALIGSAVLMLATVGASFWLVTIELRQRYDEEATQNLLTAGRLIDAAVSDGWDLRDVSAISGLVHELQKAGIAVAVLAADGEALVRADDTSYTSEDLLSQPEVQRALLLGWGVETRRLPDQPRESHVAAVRTGSDETTLGVIWLAKPAWSARASWRSPGRILASIGAVSLVSAMLLAYVLTRTRVRLIRRLADTARSISGGDLSANADVRGSDEYAALSAALNQMRRRLAGQLETIDRQRLTLQSLLDQLSEGVVVTRADGRIALINPAAMKLLNPTVDAGDGTHRLAGKSLEQGVPQHDLQELMRATSGGDGEQTVRIDVDSGRGLVHLLARVSNVDLPSERAHQDEAGTGRMLVVSDVTELTRTIRVKTDFVANASHELRTPLTAIRAAAEALVHMDLNQDSAAARRFLETIDRQSGRLEAMVKDLLDLSRLESSAAGFQSKPLSIREEFTELHARFAERLAAKGLRWSVETASDVSNIASHPHLLRLVLDNLVDNAIKFTQNGGAVRVECRREANDIVLEVVDNGCGIPVDDQERVFERFYQVERARSGAERGTGLGLSIVRHAAAALKSSVLLTSTPGAGTRVALRIPQT